MDTEDLPPPPHPEIDIMDGGDEEQDIVTVPLPDYEDDGDIMAPSFNSFTPRSADVEIGNKKEDDGLSDNEDEFDFTDADAAIDKMLDDLQDFQLTLGPDSLQKKRDEFEMLSPVKEKPPPLKLEDETLDHFRFSMASLDEAPEVDLDALLEDLCSMENEIKDNTVMQDKDVSPNELVTDEGRSSVLSMMVTQDVKDRLENLQSELEAKELSLEEQEKKIKAEKMRIALEKMKAASFQKLFIKVYDDDLKTSKTMLIDQTWTARDVKQKMIQKDDVEPGPNWCILEKLSHMYLERILEDHEYVLQAVLDWSRDTENMLVFLTRRDKNLLFRNPQNFLLDGSTSTEDAKLAEKRKDVLLNEFFKKENVQIPRIEGVLWLREGTKKWAKHYFALRASGIYYTPKGKQKSRDLSCLCLFEHNSAYLGVSFKRKFKSPTDYVLCLKHPKIQTLKSKHIYCLCAEDNKTLHQWLTGIRMAKYGYTMYQDYLQTQDELENLLLAGSQSNLSSVTGVSLSLSSTDFDNSSNQNVSDKIGVERKKVKLNQGVVSATRVQGKEDYFKNLFATAWMKGTADTQNSPPDVNLFSPSSPTDVKSPTEQSLTFDFSNRAMTMTADQKMANIKKLSKRSIGVPNSLENNYTSRPATGDLDELESKTKNLTIPNTVSSTTQDPSIMPPSTGSLLSAPEKTSFSQGFVTLVPPPPPPPPPLPPPSEKNPGKNLNSELALNPSPPPPAVLLDDSLGCDIDLPPPPANLPPAPPPLEDKPGKLREPPQYSEVNKGAPPPPPPLRSSSISE